MKNTADENQKIISACDRVLARVKACVDAGIDLSDAEFPLAVQSADIDQMFTELEKNAAAPVQVVPTPLESSRPVCYDCGQAVNWLAPDGRCGHCTGYTPEEIRGDFMPQISNADKLHYRHQPVINSVFKIPYSPDAEFKTLCQDCLRVVCHPTKQAMDMAHDEFFFCDCGGQLCACSDCSDAAALLARNGSSAIVELARLGAIKPITGPFIYSPATGIVREQSK